MEIDFELFEWRMKNLNGEGRMVNSEWCVVVVLGERCVASGEWRVRGEGRGARGEG